MDRLRLRIEGRDADEIGRAEIADRDGIQHLLRFVGIGDGDVGIGELDRVHLAILVLEKEEVEDVVGAACAPELVERHGAGGVRLVPLVAEIERVDLRLVLIGAGCAATVALPFEHLHDDRVDGRRTTDSASATILGESGRIVVGDSERARNDAERPEGRRLRPGIHLADEVAAGEGGERTAIVDRIEDHRHLVVTGARAAIGACHSDLDLDAGGIGEAIDIGVETRRRRLDEIAPGTGELVAANGTVERLDHRLGRRAIVKIIGNALRRRGRRNANRQRRHQHPRAEANPHHSSSSMGRSSGPPCGEPACRASDSYSRPRRNR